MPEPTRREPPAEQPDEVECGVEAFYAGGPGEPYYQPVMRCLCGFTTGRCDSWSEAGESYDEHRREMREPHD
jgi:hypothetical protein